MSRFWIIKANGERAWYNRKKIYRTCRRTGASAEACDAAIDKVERILRDGMTTRQILDAVVSQLEKSAPYQAPKYDLKGAIMRLGPAGFHFEVITAELLQKYGYSTTTNAMLQGGCVQHEIDIIAIKDKKCSMIECKFHQSSGIYTGIKETMYTWARFMDLNNGYKKGTCDKFHQPWLISNTKFSDDATKYANCQGVKLTGWNYPEDASYQRLLEDLKLYPITSLKLNTHTLSSFARGRIMFLRDLCDIPTQEVAKRTKLNRNEIEKLKDIAHKIIES